MIKHKDLYHPEVVSGMFDRMSKTYGWANLITSFGFTARWRRQCINDLPLTSEMKQGYDLMSGMGESWTELQRRFGAETHITAIDLSAEMNRKADKHLKRLKIKNISLRPTNILDNEIPNDSADYIVSTFGIKTFNEEQQSQLAKEIARILRPGGSFSLIEISEPKGSVLNGMYMFYLKMIIPLIGRVFLGNAEDYRMLGKYCENFKDCSYFQKALIKEGLNVQLKSYFYGCATGVCGVK